MITTVQIHHDKTEARNTFRFDFMNLLYTAIKNAPENGSNDAWRELAERFGFERVEHHDINSVGKPTD